MERFLEQQKRLEKRMEKGREKNERRAVKALHERLELLQKLKDDNQVLEGNKDKFSKRIKNTENLMGKVGSAIGEAADETTEQLFG